MKIAINCRSFLNRNYTGIGRYAYHLIKSLGEIDQINEYRLYAKKGFFHLNKKLPTFRFKNISLIVDRLNRGMEKCLGKVDIYHSPSPEILSNNPGAKKIVTVHDLIFKAFPEGHTPKTIADSERQFNDIVQEATRLICCSNNTVNDLKKYFAVPQEKIALVYQGVDKNIFYMIGKEEEPLANRAIYAQGVRDPYILSVGTIEPRKNLKNIIHAFHLLHKRKDFTGKLVVIGMKGWMDQGLESLIDSLGIKDEVIFLGYLTDQELRYFYNKAEAFVFPSFYEGFGFPIIEAFSCGTPVVTSNVSSCPEVAQDAALLVDPHDPEDIARAVGRIINQDELRRTLREKGFKRAGDFSFHKTAAQTLEVYNDVYRS